MSGPLATARRGLIASLFLLLTMAPAVSAQSILDPARIEFTPSGSQSALDVRTGTPLIQSYALDIYVAGSATVVQRVNLGNPAPDPDGMIRVDFVQLLTAPLSTGVVYEAVVTTISPSETISSVRSATFAFSAACTPGISPASSDLTTSGAATGSVAVTANASCSWQATSNATWITITAGAYGTGNATVSYMVAANTATTSRTGTMTIGGQTFTVNQAAAPCTFTLSPAGSNLNSSSAATGTVVVTAASNCNWTATSNDGWLTITAGASGSGNASVSYSVSANTSTASRTGSMTIGGQAFTVTQAGAPCAFTISPAGANLNSSAAASGTVAVTAGASCGWTATSNDGWLTITAGASGSGNANVAYGVSANTSTASRTGTMTIAGQTFTVTQAGAPCTFAITPGFSNLSSSAATTGTVTVAAGAGCAWTATSNDSWLTISGGAGGNGNGTVTYAVAANTGAALRTGTMTIAGQTFTVTQAGASCLYIISPMSSTLTGSIGASGSVTVTAGAGCGWTATSNDAWITVGVGATGTGNGNVSYNVAANTTSSSRTGTLTIAGNTFTITQPGAPCVFTITPFMVTLTSGGATTGTVTVSSGTGCDWTAVSNADWLTIASGATGTGGGTVNYKVASNPGTTQRTGTITIAGKTFTVTQPSTACSFTISSANQSFSASGGSGTVTVTTSSNCTWTAASNAAWVVISGGASGRGPGSVTYNVSANAGALARSATLTIAGKSFTVTQAGPSCTYSLTPSLITAPPAGTSGVITVTTQPTCTWTATTTSTWVTVSGSGTGSGTATYTVQANTGTIARSGLVNIGGVFVGVSQAAPTGLPND